MPRKGEYRTKQGTQLLDYLARHAGEHLTAAELLRALEKNGTPMGAATVYRQLEKLAAQGLVRRYTLDDRGSACYQYVDAHEDVHCGTHFHLKCTMCGRLFHIDCGHLDGIAAHVQTDHGFRIDPSRTVFYGRCAGCAEEQ